MLRNISYRTTTRALAAMATAPISTLSSSSPRALTQKNHSSLFQPTTTAVLTHSARFAATAAATSSSSPASSSVPQTQVEFEKFLGARQRAKHQAGKHCVVYEDTAMFGWLVMDRAGSSANALGEEFMASMNEGLSILETLHSDKKIKMAMITSAKDSFCVGADLEQMYPVSDKKIAKHASQEGQRFFHRVEKTKFPVVAAINGQALGGGCELALACHHRVIASDKGNMGLPETKLGLLPGAGGTVRLQKLIGVQKALKWILSGAFNKADRCKKDGVVDAVIPSASRGIVGEKVFLEGARAWAALKVIDKPLKPTKGKKKAFMDRMLEDNPIGRRIIHKKTLESLDKLTKGKYPGHYYAVECILHAAAVGANEKAYEKEAEKFSQLMVTPEAKNMCSLYFLDDGMKKVEAKTGVKKADIQTLKSMGVIGAGVMGAGVVHFHANKGHKVCVIDLKQEAVDKGMAFVKAEFDAAVKKKRLDKNGLKKKMALVTGSTDMNILKETEVIVEAAVEVMEIKKKLVQDLEAAGILDGKRIFATNTSSLSLTELQSVSKYPEMIVGMHFFNPVKMMPLVEVIKGKKTCDKVAAAIFNLALKTGKKPIIVNDGPGFLVNRILGAYMAEAGRMAIQDHVCPNRIDKVILNFGMPMGPFRLLDEVGLDVACHVGPVLENGLKHSRFRVDQRMEQLVKDGYLGKKNKKGLYRYNEKGKEEGMNTSVIEKYLNPRPDTRYPVEDIIDRCVLIMVNEAAMILEDKIALSPEDVDIGMVFGTGFAPFRGGLLQYADHVGAKKIVARLEQLEARKKDGRFKPATLLVKMANATNPKEQRFFPDRPFVPYVERTQNPECKVY